MLKRRILALLVLLVGGAIGYFVYNTTPGLSGAESGRYDFKLGLDLSGGTRLVYRADISNIDAGEVGDAINALYGVIDRRSNLFGVSETSVYIEEATAINGMENRIVVEIPGVTDVELAKSIIGKTPDLQFVFGEQNQETGELIFKPSGLSGVYLENAYLSFQQNQLGMSEPVVAVKFNKQGSELFKDITEKNIGEFLYILLDGQVRSNPVIREAITGGEAVISGGFTPEEAKSVAADLNLGALPVPVELISTQTIGPSLGEAAVDSGINAGMIGFMVLAAFLVVWYRLPGVIAVVALGIYGIVMFALIKFIPVTLTAAGIAGLIISIGMAVDANILIFERMKEEMRGSKTLEEAIKDGFERAWSSIRDGNLSSIITAILLYWFGTSLIKGFALTFGIGVLVSMISAISVSKILLLGITNKNTKVVKFLFGNGFVK
jgi:protein-export membrane protein SecD